jgi:dolichyl-phosphate-mannose--protein O-mannosyl transferase
MVKKITPATVLFIILLVATFFRLFRLDFPNTYVFDEVYHAFTAKEYLQDHPDAWEYWTTPPAGVAYEWTHPPLAKEIMALSMGILHTEAPWAWRLPGVLLGILSIFLVYKISHLLFKQQSLALLAAFVFSFDGLSFVQSRIGMNDIYLITFLLLSAYFFLSKDYLYCSISWGLALSSKWSAIYMGGVYIAFGLFNSALFFYENRLQFKGALDQVLHRLWHNLFIVMLFIVISVAIYLISYTPFFLQHHITTCTSAKMESHQCSNAEVFVNLQKQMWWYHTKLKATHNYSSPWWSWPLNLYPVWYYVQYYPNAIANIFASGNPIVFWLGFGSILLCIIDFIKTKSRGLLFVLLGYFGFLLPWAFSPRIMFLYHYTPCLPFLAIALGYQLNKLTAKQQEVYLITLLILIAVGFLFLYPYLSGIALPREVMLIFFKTNITKNPF